jgi:hypothetical protein
MGVARLRDGALALLRPARVLRRHRPV